MFVSDEYEIGPKIQFNLLQKRVYFLAQFKWSVPTVLPKCFPRFVIELCTNTHCEDFPAYLESGNKSITNLIPSTFYTVNFKEIVNKKRKQIGTLRMTTESKEYYLFHKILRFTNLYYLVVIIFYSFVIKMNIKTKKYEDKHHHANICNIINFY